jgi:hypothetical protein
MTAAALTQSRELWYLMRGSGLVALILLTLTLVGGIVNVHRFATPRWPRAVTALLHRNVALLSAVFLAVHVATAALDSYVPVGWWAAVIPFTSWWGPFLGRSRHRFGGPRDRPGRHQSAAMPPDPATLAGCPLAGVRLLAPGPGARFGGRHRQRHRLGAGRLRGCARCGGCRRGVAAAPQVCSATRSAAVSLYQCGSPGTRRGRRTLR